MPVDAHMSACLVPMPCVLPLSTSSQQAVTHGIACRHAVLLYFSLQYSIVLFYCCTSACSAVQYGCISACLQCSAVLQFRGGVQYRGGVPGVGCSLLSLYAETLIPTTL